MADSQSSSDPSLLSGRSDSVKARGGSIVLFHLGGYNTLAALPAALRVGAHDGIDAHPKATLAGIARPELAAETECLADIVIGGDRLHRLLVVALEPAAEGVGQ